MLTGAARAELSRRIRAVYDDPGERARHTRGVRLLPDAVGRPYIERRRKVGWDLYGLLGIGKTDKARMHAQHAPQLPVLRRAGRPDLHDRPRSIAQGSWLDYGMFLQNIMVAARARGLDTCPQAALAPFHRLIAEHLQLPASEMVVCGMSLGPADAQAIENTLVTERGLWNSSRGSSIEQPLRDR